MRPRRGRRRRAAPGGARGIRQPHHPRHGRNHRQGIAHRTRADRLRGRVRGRRRHVVAQRAHGRGRVRAQAPGHRHLRGGGRRRLDRVARQGRVAQGGPAERRRGAGAGVLRRRQRRAHGDRRQRGPRLPQPGVARRRQRAHPVRACARGDGDPTGGSARARRGGDRVRRAHRRQREHDEGGQGGDHLPGTRPPRLHPDRVRRQRRGARGGTSRGCCRSGAWCCRWRPGCSARSACCSPTWR